MSQGTVAIIGAGIVGAALLREFAQHGHSVFLLERHGRSCEETSSRNSGVLHAGIYYPKDSLKTKFCLRGNQMFREFARQRGLEFWDCGKLIVAPKEGESEIQHIFKQAQDNGVPQCRLLTQKEIRSLEPNVAGEVGVFSQTSAMIDPHTFADALIAEGEEAGGMVIYHCEVQGVTPKGSGFAIRTNRDEIEVDAVINSAGLEATGVASWFGLTQYKYHYCRGDYFVVKGAKYTIQHLVYPTPDHEHQALGVHITPDKNGRIRLGPDAVYIDSHLDVKDGAEDRKHHFYAGAKRLLPDLQPSQLAYDMWGIRPKLKPPDSDQFYDFVIEQHPKGVVHLIGIESPGLTASMAIAAYVRQQFFA